MLDIHQCHSDEMLAVYLLQTQLRPQKSAHTKDRLSIGIGEQKRLIDTQKNRRRVHVATLTI